VSRVSESVKVSRIPVDQVVSWNPLARQQLERDTIFLLDPELEQSLTLAQGQLPMGSYFDPPTDSGVPAPPIGHPASAVEIVDGRYRKGLRSPAADSDGDLTGFGHIVGQFRFPIELPIDEWHLEMWLASEGAALSGTPLRILPQGDGMDITLGWGVTWSAPGPFQAYALPVDKRPAAGELVSVACGLDPSDSTLNFWFNGERLYRQVVTPPAEPSSGYLQLLRNFSAANRYRISDVKLSAKYREPRESITLHGRPRIVVDPGTLTGQVTNKDLCGAVKGLGNAYTETTAADKLTVVRLDKWLSATPIKAGAPDGTHTVLGASGDYSYDPQVLYRAADYAVTTLGCKIYLSIDSTPQILGGASPPYSGVDLASGRLDNAVFNNERPADLVEYGKIVGDLLTLLLARHPGSVEYAGCWNEPEAQGFLEGVDEADRRTYIVEQLYPVHAATVKAIDPTIKVGGPELSGWHLTWAEDLIDYCQANDVPLDFISWHWYDSNVWLLRRARRELDEACVAAGHPLVQMVIGEWLQVGVQMMRTPPFSGAEKNGTLDLMHGAYGAAYLARAFMEMVRADVAIACTYVPEDTVDPGYTPRGTLLTSSHKWAALNVHEQWLMMADDLVDTTIENGRPELDAIAAVNGDQVDVLIAYCEYRNTLKRKVTLEIDVPDGTPATAYVVDDDHSSWLNAGPTHQDLESYDAGIVRDGQLQLTLRARTSLLVRIGEP
jgi:hypothetical protein